MSVGSIIRVSSISAGEITGGVEIDGAGAHTCVCDGRSCGALEVALGDNDRCRNIRNSDDTLIKWFMKSKSISDRLPVGRLASKRVMESISVCRVPRR